MKFRRTIFKNGLRVITAPLKDSLSVNVMVMVNAGGKDENKDNNGISHFLEHMCFKGTKKRPTSLKLSSEFDSLGASSNALTSHDWTGYYATVTPEHAAKAVELVADLYLNPIYAEAEIKKEKGVVKEEIKLYEDKPTSHVWEVFTQICFGDTPPGWSVLGTNKVINQLSKQDLIKYRKRHYFANKTLVLVAGNFNEAKMLKLLSKYFSRLPRREVGEKREPVVVEQKVPQVKTSYRKIDQTHLVLGFRTVDIYAEENYALMVLAAVLGGGMSSRLFQSIREKMGAAYYVGAAQNSYADHGYLALYAGVDSNKIKEVIKTMLSECSRLKTRLVSAKELKRVKDSMLGNLYLNLETPSDLAYFYGEQEILDKPVLTPDELGQRIKRIKAEEIREIARRYFTADRLNLALVGPHMEAKVFETLLKIK